MGRSPCCDDSGLKKGPWTPDEDEKLVNYVQKHGHSSWRALPKLAGLNRCGKSCRLRWTNYLRPDIKRGKFSPDEEQTILNLHAVLGNKWSTIANHLPGRTDNEIKNFWNTHLKKKLIQMGFDPMTHRPRTDLFSSLSQLMSLSSNLRGFVDMQQQFPTDQDQTLLKLQTEMAKLQLFQYFLQPPSMNNINPNDFDHTLNLLNSIASFKDANNLGFIGSYLQDFNSLPSLKTLNSNTEQPSSVFPQNIDENHIKFFSDQRENNLPLSPIWLSDPSSLNQSLLPSLDPSSGVSEDLITNQYVIEDVNSNITSSSCQESGSGSASASAAWPDHLLDDSIFSDIP